MRETSIEAGRSISPEEISQTQARIVDVLQEGPLTDEEIQARLPDVSPSSLRTRRSELVTLGLVEESGEFRASSSGRRMTVWRVHRQGMRPNSMPGRPDRYVNIDLARAQAADAERRAEEERVRQLDESVKAERRQLPWLDAPPRFTFGEIPCRFCRASGGNKADGPCSACGGTGKSGMVAGR